MSDTFQIVPYKVRSAGTDVPPEEIQTAINSLASQTQLALNTLAAGPTGPAGGDLSGTYPNPTVSAVHATSGTESGVTVTGNTINSSPIGQTTPAAGAFTTLTATTPVAIGSGGTGSSTAAGARTNLGLGTLATQNANNVAVTGGTIDNTPIGQTTTAAGSFTTLNSTGGALNGTVGGTTPNTGAFTTLSASSGLNSTPVGNTTPSTGAFTTLSATTPVAVGSGGTGRSTLTAHAVLVGETASAVNEIGPGTTGQMLLGVTGADPAFGNNPTITGGTIDGAVIGGTTPAAGSFTTLSSTGNFTPSQTNGIVGTTTNNNANAGSVGEFVTATGTAVSLTTATGTNVTSVSLTAGDWDVWGNIAFAPAGSTVISLMEAAVNTTSATIPADPFRSFTAVTQGTGQGGTQMAPSQRFSLSATTTVFLVALASFSTSTCTATGYIAARRRR